MQTLINYGDGEETEFDKDINHFSATAVDIVLKPNYIQYTQDGIYRPGHRNIYIYIYTSEQMWPRLITPANQHDSLHICSSRILWVSQFVWRRIFKFVITSEDHPFLVYSIIFPNWSVHVYVPISYKTANTNIRYRTDAADNRAPPSRSKSLLRGRSQLFRVRIIPRRLCWIERMFFYSWNDEVGPQLRQ